MNDFGRWTGRATSASGVPYKLRGGKKKSTATKMDETEATSGRAVAAESKRRVAEQLLRYDELLRTALREQSGVPEETRRRLQRELLASFAEAVRDNVLVNGRRWDDAPDDGDEAVVLENLLDDAVVELAQRRRRCPRVVLQQVVRGLRAERQLLSLYEESVKPQQLVKDPSHESIMNSVCATAPGLVKEATEVMKSIQTLQKQADGLCQVLNSQPSQASLEVQEAVFGPRGQSDALSLGKASSVRQPIRRVVEEATATSCFVLPAKKSH